MAAPPTIGIDIGGTKIAAGVVDASGAIIARRRIATEAEHPNAIVAGVTKVAQELQAAAPAAAAVGVGAAGLIDAGRGVVLGAPNIAWSNVHLRDMLADRVNLPVVVDNDANVAAWGEARHGAGRGAGDQVMLTVGTGVGGGLILNGSIYRGARGIGAEIGHIVVQAGGPACACGNHGCLEAMASGTAIGRIARARAAEDADEAAEVIARAGSIAQITGETVGDAAVAGDGFARGVVAEAGRWLGVGIASLVNLLDPDIVVVGGGVVAGTGDLVLAPARESAASLVIGHTWRTSAPVVPAALGNDAGVIGAAALARTLL